MRHIQLFATKIYFGVIEIYVKYILNMCQIYFGEYTYLTFIKKIYVEYILIIQLLAKIYFIHFDIHIYVIYIYIFFYMSNVH